jgi:Ni/Co efflux regulator RcnB
MKKCIIAILLAGFAWFVPAASASDRAAYVPAVYNPGASAAQFELVGKRHKKHYKHHRHHRHHHRSSYRSHRSHHHHYRQSRHYDHCYPYRHYRSYSISVPGFGSFYYSR